VTQTNNTEMTKPLILSTWTFGKRANDAAWPGLSAGGAALDAVETACRDAESDLENHTVGVGGYPDRDGTVSLDASIMLSPSRCGAVAAVRRFAHPISIARKVMERSPHVLLAGEGADDFAESLGFTPQSLQTDESYAAWKKWRDKHVLAMKNIEERPLPKMRRSGEEHEFHDTIGVLAIDSAGTIAGACSTSGYAFKVPGRVGDSPIVGHGLYVDPDHGAAVATGRGELVMGVCGTFLAVEALRRGADPLNAGMEVLQRIADSYELTDDDQVGLIVLARDGTWAGVSLRTGFRIAVRTADVDELREPEHVLIA
jgi:isoaspartyl peptidase/L-asparaginase-like protein (Ntn-hydrolase superfamily)